MKNRQFLRFVVVLIAIVALSQPKVAQAQTIWYTVELIVFQHLSNDGLYSEHWPPNLESPIFGGAVQLSEETTEVSDVADMFSAFELLPSTEFQLSDAVGHLRRSSAYRPLLHIAWHQPGYTRSEALKVHIHSGITNQYKADKDIEYHQNQAINGTIQLYRARYLHLETDLYHYREIPSDSPTQATTFRMQGSRRMRSRELHYIDHPLIGVLVLVTPYEPLESEVDTEELSQLQLSDY